MKQLIHPHVVHLIGVCTKDEPVFAVMELMVYGDLKSYLLSHRVNVSSNESTGRNADCLSVLQQHLESPDLQLMAVEVCRAVDYMHSRQYVHRYYHGICAI